MSEHDRPQDAGSLSRGAQVVGGCDSWRARGAPGKVARTSRLAGGNAVQRKAAIRRPATSPAAAHGSVRDTAGRDERWGDAMTVWEQTLPAPDGVFIFWSPEPGVILYEYRKGRLVPVPIPAAKRGKQQQPAREWRWELEPLTRAQEQALLTGAAGTALLILMMLLLAPVGA